MQQLNNLWRSATTKQPPSSTQSKRKSQDPVLTAEDEAFLQAVASETPLPEDSAQTGENQPTSSSQPGAPISPVEEFGRELGEQERKKSITSGEVLSPVDTNKSKRKGKGKEVEVKGGRSASPEKKRRPWSIFGKKKEPQAPPATNTVPTTDIPAEDKEGKELQQENEDMTEILDKLNLAAENNRVFSISEETQELLKKFKLIFKDLITGVPTAYHDLEMLLTNGNRQLQDTYTNLPSFLQKLIEKLPERWTETLAPEMLAVAAERASRSGINVDNVGKAAAAANKMGLQVPSLKELVGKPAAIAGMFRSIVAFLRARFPAVLGVNVLWSLALFILLFVLWYCHKRGREVRLENERLVTDEEIEKLNEESADTNEAQIRSTETLTTTAARGASLTEIREGIKEAQKARANQATATEATEQAQKQPVEEERPRGVENEPIKPTRSKSILSIFGRSASTSSTPKVEPYPGT
ncbi:hypothetical protein BJY04DRAFT_107895 [Aspergillus karnatakaensis]|uniref:uncharacterized protein n=1 Tax=Aspergillus karnatakaensis TaxID=1810916 RepID=UPI003CCCAB57